MKRILLSLGLILLFLSCEPPSRLPTVRFGAVSPRGGLLAADIAALGVADHITSTASDKDIADGILAWQADHMFLAAPDDYPDVSYPMRWNFIMPGIYPVKDMIAPGVRRTTDDKIYGVCWDFSAIFVSIADYYGLETRITAWKRYMSGVAGGRGGMSETEYGALKPRLDAKGLDFSSNLMNEEARETWVHYRAEVKIGSVWQSYDGTDPTGDYLINDNYTEAAWDEGKSPILCY